MWIFTSLQSQENSERIWTASKINVSWGANLIATSLLTSVSELQCRLELCSRLVKICLAPHARDRSLHSKFQDRLKDIDGFQYGWINLRSLLSWKVLQVVMISPKSIHSCAALFCCYPNQEVEYSLLLHICLHYLQSLSHCSLFKASSTDTACRPIETVHPKAHITQHDIMKNHKSAEAKF